jgi:hypothetical protein
MVWIYDLLALSYQYGGMLAEPPIERLIWGAYLVL